MRNNLYTFLLYFAFPLPLAACWLANRLKAKRLRIRFHPDLSWHSPLASCVGILRWFCSWSLLGSCVLADLFLKAAKRRDHIDLFLMLWILIPLPIVYYAHLPMKYLPSLHTRRHSALFPVAGWRFGAVCPSRSRSIDHCQHRLFSSDPSLGRRVCEFRPGRPVSIDQAARCSRRKGLVPRTVLVVLVRASGWSDTYIPGWPPAKARRSVGGGRVSADGDHSPLKRFPHRTLVEAISHKYRFGRTVGAGIGGLYSGFWLWGLGNRVDDRYELWRID